MVNTHYIKNAISNDIITLYTVNDLTCIFKISCVLSHLTFSLTVTSLSISVFSLLYKLYKMSLIERVNLYDCKVSLMLVSRSQLFEIGFALTQN